MYKNKFVVSVIHDGHPVKETGSRNNKEVVVPFNSEYKIRLKNKNNRSCTANVFIDDKRVSPLGDFIIHAGGSIDLERFVDRSLTEGKKFKFVPLSNSDVDDPTSSENGIIRVEFKLAKQENGIKINRDDCRFDFRKSCKSVADIKWQYIPTQDSSGMTTKRDYFDNRNMHYCSSDIGSPCSNMVENGATVEGGSSSQSFVYDSLEIESNMTVLKLKIVGVRGEDIKSSGYRYCTQCGRQAGLRAKYCSRCGHRL